MSESGAATVGDITSPVIVRTQSGAIKLTNLGGTAGVTSGSGSVTIDGVTGPLTVTTKSSAIRGTSIGGGVHMRTIGGDGPCVNVTSRSGSIRIAVQ